MTVQSATHRTLWLQGGELFSYPPAPEVSSSRVVKLAFEGSLSTRALYIYLPRGYDEHTHLRYPVLYMHDGQNLFEAFASDSFSGSWRADEAADALIRSGRMQEVIIVGVSNGRERRLSEYLPPYSTYTGTPPKPKGRKRRSAKPVRIEGSADKTYGYYRDEVARFVNTHYRTLAGRENTATCGASMGGLFSTYLAWEHPEFAERHAVMSPSYWLTRNPDGTLETVERVRCYPKLEVRLWLDSGEGTEKIPGEDDDNKCVTLEAKEALLEAGYLEGRDFVYHLEPGAAHHESAWAQRLPKVFEFLFPVGGP